MTHTPQIVNQRTGLVARAGVVCLLTALTASVRIAGAGVVATHSTRGEPGKPGFRPDVRETLHERAARERAEPAQGVPGVPFPPGVDPAALAPAAPRSPTTDAALDAVIAERRASRPAGEPLTFSSINPDARRRALHSYAQGRAKLLAGEVADAIADLERCTRLDTSAAEPWRELGEAQMAAGRRASALVSFQNAVRRGLNDPMMLWILGRDALRREQFAQASEYLAHAWDTDPESSDAALPYLVASDLADALTELGHFTAAAQALEEAADLPEPFTSPTRLGADLAAQYRKRERLFRDLGDLEWRAGHADAALDAYEEAGRRPSLDQGLAVARAAYVLLSQGRPASAAVAVLDWAESGGGQTDDRVPELLRYVARRTALGQDLLEAVRSIEPRPSSGASGPARSRDLWIASVSAPDAERDTLVGLIARTSPDPRAWRALIGSLDGETPEAIAGVCTRALGRAPAHATHASAVLAESRADLDAVLAALDQDRTDPAAMLAALLRARLGHAVPAANAIAGRAWTPECRPEGRALEAVLQFNAGRFAEANTLADDLAHAAASGDDRTVRAAASAALGVQRPKTALDIMRPLIDRPGAIPDVGDFFTAISAALNASDPAVAEDLLRRTLELDPTQELVYAGMLSLYGPRGDVADSDKLAQAAGSLRNARPSSRLLRLLTAQEMLGRQMESNAEAILLDLADEQPGDEAAGSVLTMVWEARAAASAKSAAGGASVSLPSLARAEAWLHKRSNEHPDILWLRTALARILTAGGRAAEAEQSLVDRLKVRPAPDLARLRESILREPLGNPDEANAAAHARVDASPRPIDSSVELADLLIGEKKTSDALDVLRTGIPEGIVLTPQQGARLGILLARVAQNSGATPTPANADTAAFFDLAAERRLLLPPALHESRLRLLAAAPETDPAAIERAMDFAVSQHPKLSSSFRTRLAATYLESGRGREALPHLRRAVADSPAPPPELVFTLVQQTATVGELDDLHALVDQLTDPEQVAGALKVLMPTDAPPSGQPELRAQLAYRIGSLYSYLGRTSLSNEAKRLALRLNPDLAWAKNDLGYQLLEDGPDFTEATRLIEEAYTALPNEPSIIDSMGWLRYQQGDLTDTGTSGAPAREGAVTLLRRAVETADGKNNATLHDHLGDALWAAGQRDDAKAAWAKAEELGAKDLEQLRGSRTAPKAAIERTTKELDAVRAKRQAAQSGQEPAIAPMRLVVK